MAAGLLTLGVNKRTAIVEIDELPLPRGAHKNATLRKAYLKNRAARMSAPNSGPTTPSMRSARSPLNPSSAATSAETKAELEALRIPLVHLLALGPVSEHSLASKTKAPEDMVLKVLNKVGNRVEHGRRWSLADDVYKELDVWDFPYHTPDDREKAIAHCREAFGRLRLEKRAPEWRLLLSPEEREKADLFPEPPPEPVKPASARSSVRPGSESGRSPLAETPRGSASTSTRGTPKTTKASAKSDPISRIINGKGKKKVAAPAKSKAPVGRPPKNHTAAKAKPAPQRQTAATTNPKIKSAEVIVDSDEDVEMEDVKLLPPKPPARKTVSPQPQVRPPPPPPPPPQRRPVSKPSSKSTSAAASDMEGDRGVRLNLTKNRSTAPSTTGKSPVKRPRPTNPTTASKSPAIQTNGTKQTPSIKSLAPRDQPRASSNSPSKPSPLGSSPPINASEGSTSSSPSFTTSLSTASQSPLDSLSGRHTTSKPRYVPVPAITSLKRKAGETVADSAAPPPRKRMVVPDGHTMKLARKFREDYAKYLRLYREAETTRDPVRRREVTEEVMRCHRDLERMKGRITTSYGAVVH